MPTIKKIDVIGAGQMGGGLAHSCARAGYEVITSNISPEALQKSIGGISNAMNRQVQKGKLTEADKEAALARISTGSDLSWRSCKSSTRA